MNVLLVGLGRWGGKHLRVLKDLGATVWVADVSPAQLEWAVGQGGRSRARRHRLSRGAVARRRRRHRQVGHIFRFHPVTAVLRDALAAGRLGSVRYATGRFSGFKRPRTDVGVTHTDALHYFYSEWAKCLVGGRAAHSAA